MGYTIMNNNKYLIIDASIVQSENANTYAGDKTKQLSLTCGNDSTNCSMQSESVNAPVFNYAN